MAKYSGIMMMAMFMICHLEVQSQDSYIVTLKGDTISGEVIFSSAKGNIDKLFFRPPGGKKRAYQAIELRTLYHEGSHFKILRYQGYRFMKIQKSGYLSLLKFRDERGIDFNRTLLYKMDGQMRELPRLNFKKPMANFLSDCDLVALRVKNRELQLKDLNEIVDDYNLCIQERTEKRGLESSQDKRDEPETISDNNSEAYSIISDLKETYANEGAKTGDFEAIIGDIEGKLEENETVPPYLIQALKESISGSKDLEKLVKDLEKELGQN